MEHQIIGGLPTGLSISKYEVEPKKVGGLPIDLDLSKYELRLWCDGDCMDSPDSTIKIRDGQRVLMHEIGRDDGLFPYPVYMHIAEMRGKVCVVQYIADGKRYFTAKVIVGIDELKGRLRMVCYNPQKTFVSLKLEAIEKVYLVDGVEE